MARRRVSIRAEDQIAVFRMSRRRCCICYGLDRDDGRKPGQIAHLDRNPSNAKLENLAWLCLPHHDEYDSKTSQSKSLQIGEVKSYRAELYALFAHWSGEKSQSHLLRFLAATVDDDAILDGAIRVASHYRALPEALVEQVLSWDEFDSMDMDIWVPHLSLLEDFKSWGLLTYELDERSEFEVYIRVSHEPICADLLARLRSRSGKPDA